MTTNTERETPTAEPTCLFSPAERQRLVNVEGCRAVLAALATVPPRVGAEQVRCPKCGHVKSEDEMVATWDEVLP